MQKRGANKAASASTVGVIASRADLRWAHQMQRLPDFFELRLDYLRQLRESELAGLKCPLIITARSRAEGGATNLNETTRRDLLLKFLPHAAFVDVELRSLPRLRSVWDEAQRQGVGRICSLHDHDRTPALSVLVRYLKRAKALKADVFKLVTRADSVDSVSSLLNFLRNKRAPRLRCVMATGRFGRISRLLFPECGSTLVYAPVRKVFHDGQLTLKELQAFRDFYAKT